METKIKILIAEDQALMRHSLNSFLNDDPLLEVVGEAANGRELLDLLKNRVADVVLLDIEMPVLNGLDTLKIVRQRFPETRVIILSLHKELFYVKAAMTHGAHGYLSKDCEPSQLLNAVRVGDQTRFFMEDAVMKDLALESLYGPRQKRPNALSARETEVLKALCDGMSEKEIAAVLHISSHTVHFHRMNLHAKTQSHNLAGLVKYARAHNLV